MNDLERAAIAVVDRPVASPAPLEAIERRAGTLRRRRRVLEAGAIAVVVLLLGTAGLVLSSVRSDDRDQGVFVGEGLGDLPGGTVSTYHLTNPVDHATGEALKQTVEARFRWFGAGDADVLVDGTEVTVMARTPADRIDALVTSSGGFLLRPTATEVDGAQCVGGLPDVATASALAGPPVCYRMGTAYQLPRGDANGAGYSRTSVAESTYQTTLDLGPASETAMRQQASQLLCAGCLPETVALVTDGVILHPRVLVRDAGDGIELTIPGFVEPDEAAFWAAVLSRPLPDGVSFQR